MSDSVESQGPIKITLCAKSNESPNDSSRATASPILPEDTDSVRLPYAADEDLRSGVTRKSILQKSTCDLALQQSIDMLTAAINGVTSEMKLHRENQVGHFTARRQDKYSGG